MDLLLLCLALISSGFMAWAVGANDVANAMGTSVGSKIITIKQAIFIAAVFEGLGALLASGTVTGTLRNDVLDVRFYDEQIIVLARGMIASLSASATWLIIATRKGWPVSTTHSIVGALVGFGLVTQGVSKIRWINIGYIAAGWVLTPIVSAFAAWVCFRIVQRSVLMRENPVCHAVRFVSFTIAILVLFGIESSLRYTEMTHLHGIGILLSGLVYLLAYYMLNLHSGGVLAYRDQCQYAELLFGRLALLSACALAYAHGANDVANAIGPMVSVVDINTYGYLPQESNIPLWVLFWGAGGVVLGLAMYGYKIIASVGTKITMLSPSRSFSAQAATATVVLVASWLGYPVSTTHTLVGAVLGVGLARGLAAVNLSVIRGIFMSWCITVPAGAIFSIVYFSLLSLVI